MSQVAAELYRKEEFQKVIDILTPLERVGEATEWDVVRLVSSLRQLKRYETALAIVRHHPLNPRLDYDHVRILRETGRSEEAEFVRQNALDYALKKIEHAQPGKEKADWLHDVAVLQADRRRRIKYYEMSLKEDPDCFVVNFNLAICLRDEGQNDKALKYARRCVDLEPGYARVISLVKQLEDTQPKREIDSRLTDSTTCDKSSHNRHEDKRSLKMESLISTLKTENATIKTENARLKIENSRLKTTNVMLNREIDTLKKNSQKTSIWRPTK